MDFYNENISAEMNTVLARRAWFSFNVNTHDSTGMDGFNGADWRLAGEGVDTIDLAISLLRNGTNQSLINADPVVQLDYGSLNEDLQQVGVQNLQELRSIYVQLHGTVNRPDVYGSPDN